MADRTLAIRIQIEGNKQLQDLGRAIDNDARALKGLNKRIRESKKVTDSDIRAKNGLTASLKANRNAYRDNEREVLKNNNALRKNSGFVQGVAKGVEQWATSMLGITLAIGLANKALNSAIKTIKDFDEGVANLQKVTGLAREEAAALAKELLNIDTRTSVDALLALAVAGGRLGLEGQELIDFTVQADKAFVSLGDSLEGSAEDIGLSLGKIAANFGIEEEVGIGEAINKIGSSLNELGANSKATEGQIQDFTNRLSGVASAANLSIPEVQALGALFSETGQSIEVASSTFNKLLPAMGKDVAGFAKVAGVNIDEFSILIRDKPFEALKLVAEGAKSSTKGLEGLSQTLKSYGINNARAAAIVTTLSNNTDRLTELQLIANEAFEEGTSLSEEFAIKNNTLSAEYEKLTNNFDKFVLSVADGGGVLSEVFRDVVGLLNNLLTGVSDLINFDFNNATDGINTYLKIITGVDFELDQVTVKVKRLEDATRNLTSAQIESKKVELAQEYIEAGLSAEEATRKVFDLINATNQVKSTITPIEEAGEEDGGGSELTKKELADIERQKKKNEKIKADRIKFELKLQDQLKAIAVRTIVDDREREEAELRLSFEKKIEAIEGNSELEKEVRFRLSEELHEALNAQQEEFREEDLVLEQERIQIKRTAELELELINAEEDFVRIGEILEKKRALELSNEKLSLEERALINAKFNQKALDNEKAFTDFKKQNNIEIAQSAANLAGALSGLAKEGSDAAKAAAIVQAGINGALAITQALAQLGPIAGAIAAVGIGITTGVQIAKISSAEFARGGVLQGDSHAQGGIPFTINGNAGFEAEGGEALMTKNAVKMFGAELSAMNVAGGGVAFARGGRLTNKFQTGGSLPNSVGVTASQQRQSIESGLGAFAEQIVDGINEKEVLNVASNTSDVANEVQNTRNAATF